MQKVAATQEGSSVVASVAVLSFDDLSARKNLGYLGDGVAEDIITALSRFPDLAVIARNSSFAYKGKAVDMRQIGESWALAICSKVASARTMTSFGSPLSSSTRRLASTFGQSVSTGLATTPGNYRTRSPE